MFELGTLMIIYSTVASIPGNRFDKG